MNWALICSGGAALGAVQVYPAGRLIDDLGMPALLCGTSVGASTVAMCGSGRVHELPQLWQEVAEAPGTSWFQAPNLDVWNGAFSLNPLRKQLKRHGIAPDGLKAPTHVGLVDAAKQRHRMVHLNSLSTADMHDAIVASSMEPGIHERTKFQGRWCLDGGVAHVIPTLAPGWEPDDFQEIHVILCSPVGRDRVRERTQDEVNSALEQANVTFEMWLSRVVNDDLDRVRRWAARGEAKVFLYAPDDWDHVGTPLDADFGTIIHRRDVVGQDMYYHRVQL